MPGLTLSVVLLSSHRDYETEMDWEWLRNDSPYADVLLFEPVGEQIDRFEMVVTSRWSSRVCLTTTTPSPLYEACTHATPRPSPTGTTAATPRAICTSHTRRRGMSGGMQAEETT